MIKLLAFYRFQILAKRLHPAAVGAMATALFDVTVASPASIQLSAELLPDIAVRWFTCLNRVV